MIKRPLLFMFGAFITGMYFAWQELPIAVIISIMFIVTFLIYVLMYRIKKKVITRQDCFLWLLPLLLLFGFLDTREQLHLPSIYHTFDKETPCQLTGKISMVVIKQWGKALYVKNNTMLLAEGDQYTSDQVIVYCYDKKNNMAPQDPSITSEYLVGNQITVYGTLTKFSEAVNPGQFNEKSYYQIENIDFKLIADKIELTDAHYSIYHAFFDKIKNKLLSVYNSILSKKEAGTLIAMLLGEKYLLDEEIKQLYQGNGISHVLAISGLHVSLIGMAVFYLLKKLKLPIFSATFIAILFIYSYGVLTDFSVSTNRAVVMMAVMLMSALFGKTYDMLSALALSALIILIQNPLQLCSVGFLLSYGAILGIALIYPCLEELYSSKSSIVKSFYLSLSAQITTTPIILYFYYQIPVYSILINLIILPLVTILTLTSILAGIIGAIYLPFGVFFIGGANYILKFYEAVCRVGNQLPHHLVTIGRPTMFRLFLSALFIFLFAAIAKKFKKKSSVILLLASLIILLLPKNNDGFEVTFLDVGQGDAVYMETKSGTTYLVDGGSSDVKKVGIYRIQPFLLFQGKDHIDYAIMTHSDSDHISGLKEMIMEGIITIRQLVLPAIADKDEAYMELEKLAEDKKIAITYIKREDCIVDDKIKMLCLHPSFGYTSNSSNAYSTVLSITYDNFDMLLTGDLEKDGEDQIITLLQNTKRWSMFDKTNTSLRPAIDYDILKVAHHGSKNSTMEEFLKLIKPEISVISCGKDNWYGHPHQELLKRLEQSNSKTLITYESGAITIKTDGKKLWLREYR